VNVLCRQEISCSEEGVETNDVTGQRSAAMTSPTVSYGRGAGTEHLHKLEK